MTFKKPGILRLKGADLESLRIMCFIRDKGRCQAEIAGKKCNKQLYLEARYDGDPDAFDMAHKGGKRNHGDTLKNVEALCHFHHDQQHRYGKSYVKPVPKKEQQ